MGRRTSRGRHPRRLGRRRDQARAAGRRPRPHVPTNARWRPAVEPTVRARQPRQAQCRGRPRHWRRPRPRACDHRHRGRLPHEHSRLGPATTRPGSRRAPGRQRSVGLRARYRLRAGGPRRGSAGLRHRRVLGPFRPRGRAHAPGRRAAVSTRRHGRPQRGDDRGRDDQRGARRARTDGQGPARLDVVAPPGRVHDRLRRQHRARCGAGR